METKLRTQSYIKRRDPYICNIKAFLIFLVVFGHAIEPYIDRPEINIIYRIIYAFHMPLFVFVTGMSMKNYSICINKFTCALKMYLICQPVFLLYDYSVNGNIGSLIKPYWHLWYLNALVLWSVMGMGIIWLYEHKINKNALFVFTLVLSLLIGGAGWADRRFAVQRTIAFLPFFYLGMITDVRKIRKKRALASLFGVMAVCFGIYIVNSVSADFLYYATPYRMGFCEGMLLRSLCIVGAVSIGGFILCVMPDKNIFVTKCGKDTLPVYIFHPVIIRMAKPLTGLFGNILVFAVVLSVCTVAMLYAGSRFFRPVCSLNK